MALLSSVYISRLIPSSARSYDNELQDLRKKRVWHIFSEDFPTDVQEYKLVLFAGIVVDIILTTLVAFICFHLSELDQNMRPSGIVQSPRSTWTIENIK